jgi:hypothetical protein
MLRDGCDHEFLTPAQMHQRKLAVGREARIFIDLRGAKKSDRAGASQRFTRVSRRNGSRDRASNFQKEGDDTMKRIIAMVLAGGLSALTLAAAPAHADEGRAYDGRDGVQQQYDRRDRAPQRDDRRERDARDRRDEDAYRRSDDDRYDGYRQQEQHRDPRDRHASVGIGTGNVGVRIDIGRWLAHG